MILQQIEYKNLSIAARHKAGKDKLIVGIHGLQSNSEFFDDLFEQEELRNYSKLSIDLIGFGKSDKPKDFSYDLKHQAEAVASIIDHFSDQGVIIIGHSMGGMVGTLLTDILGSRVEVLINLEGNFFPEDAGASSAIAAQTMPQFESSGYKSLISKIQTEKSSSVQKRLKWVTSTPPHVLLSASKSILAWSSNDRLVKMYENSKARTLFIYGSKNQDKASRLPSQLLTKEIPNSGHFMLLENAEDTFSAICGFLQE